MLKRTFLALLGTGIAVFAGPLGKTEMKADVFYIEDPDEAMLEEFVISGATWNLRQDEDGTWEFTVKVETSKALKRSESRAEVFHDSPGFEATAILPAKEASISKGKIIIQRESYDRERQMNLSWAYYSGGGSLDKLHIEILEEQKGILDVQLTGYFESLRSKVALRTKLKKDPKLKRLVQ